MNKTRTAYSCKPVHEISVRHEIGKGPFLKIDIQAGSSADQLVDQFICFIYLKSRGKVNHDFNWIWANCSHKIAVLNLGLSIFMCRNAVAKSACRHYCIDCAFFYESFRSWHCSIRVALSKKMMIVVKLCCLNYNYVKLLVIT